VQKNIMKKIRYPFLIAYNSVISLLIRNSSFHLTDSIRRDSINRVTQQDYNNMLAQLHITSHGPVHRKSICTECTQLLTNQKHRLTHSPGSITLKNGKKVTMQKTWWEKRRPEIVEDFDKEIYGLVSNNLPKVTGK
jgi:hypothetical protein